MIVSLAIVIAAIVIWLMGVNYGKNCRMDSYEDIIDSYYNRVEELKRMNRRIEIETIDRMEQEIQRRIENYIIGIRYNE